jgi:hypothetical protein
LHSPQQHIFTDLLGIELTGGGVVRGDPEGRRAASKRLQEGVVVKVPAVLETPNAGLQLDQADRGAPRTRRSEGQVDNAAQNEASTSERNLQSLLSAGEPSRARHRPHGRDSRGMFTYLVGETIPALGVQVGYEADDRLVARALDRRHGVHPWLADVSQGHPLAEQRVHQDPSSKLDGDGT